MRRDPTFDGGSRRLAGYAEPEHRSAAARAGGLALDNPVAAGGLLVMALTGSLIVANAVSFQPGPHPAPLFISRLPETVVPAAPRASELLRDIQIGLNRAGFYHGAIDGLGGPRTEDAVRAYQARQGLPVTGHADQSLLAHITLNSDIPLPRSAPSAEQIGSTAPLAEPMPAGPERSTVRAVQQLLSKLGYGPISVDGLMGAETAGAVRRFELDRGMPIDGRLDERLYAVLEKISGESIPR